MEESQGGQTVSEKLINKLLEYIDARIAEKSPEARNSSDGGLVEAIATWKIKEELMQIVQSTNTEE